VVQELPGCACSGHGISMKPRSTQQSIRFSAFTNQFGNDNRMSWKGKYRVKNPLKYKGNHLNVQYRSGLELTVMNYFDKHTDVLEWNSEEYIVPYRSPIDGRIHRYYVDFYAKFKNKDGSITKVLIEVKPKKQTQPPVKKGRVTRRYITEVKTWGVNSAKWEAATAYANAHDMKFVIMTESDIKGLQV
jgi:hypothetical protein